MQRVGQAVQTIGIARAVSQPRKQQAEHAQLFVKRCAGQLGGAHALPSTVKNFLNAVNALVLVV